MTLNIAHGRRGGPHKIFVPRKSAEANLDLIAETILRAKADVVALQEADAPSLWSGHIHHVERLARLSGLNHLFHGEHVCIWRGRRRICYGSALLSRHPLSDVCSHRFARSIPTPTKGFVAATVKVPGPSGRSMRVASVHLDFARKRVRQSQVIHMAETLSCHRGPLVILGDFNCQWEGTEDTLPFLSGLLKVRPYHPGHAGLETYPSRRPRRRLDWILASQDLAFRSYAVLPDRVSDHLPVIAEVGRAG